ncbi:MAG: hypothetical protein M1838_004599 [Thelocarpon superellum]|nr:MAG: hypothetical protein M1838_004599 [Thelocarpon superellum]
MAIALGLHQAPKHRGPYAKAEREEGGRAWWLSYVMEKTFSVIFGRPSSVGDFTPTAPLPELFPPYVQGINAAEYQISDEEYQVARENDIDAVAFWRDMINLSNVRDGILRMSNVSTSMGQPATASNDPDYLRLVSDQLNALLYLHPRLDFKVRPDASLRDTIGDLSHHNALQVVATHLQTHLSQPAPAPSIHSARTSLQTVLETRSVDGKTMCLWMWLYYTFSAMVVLFLHFAHDPLHPDAAADLALLSDCEGTGKRYEESGRGGIGSE